MPCHPLRADKGVTVKSTEIQLSGTTTCEIYVRNFAMLLNACSGRLSHF